MSPENSVLIPLIYLPSHIFMFWNPKYIDNVLETETEKKNKSFSLVIKSDHVRQCNNLACHRKELYLILNAPLVIL